MKSIAILGSGSDRLLLAIVNYFNKGGIDIKCFSNDLKSDFFKTAKNLGLESKYLPYEETAEYFNALNFNLIVLADYNMELNSEILNTGRFINIHPSLLPAFKGKDAISRAFTSGVKVSGVTVHLLSQELDGGAILAQYPVLIGNLMHFDEFQESIYDLEKLLYPIVIDKVLRDEVFDFSDLISLNNCRNCSGCH